jgi:hypothetical protein
MYTGRDQYTIIEQGFLKHIKLAATSKDMYDWPVPTSKAGSKGSNDKHNIGYSVQGLVYIAKDKING